MNFFIRYEHALRTNKTRGARRQIKHVALSEQTIRAVLIQDHSTVDFGSDLERDSTRNIRFDYAGNNVRARRLRSDNQMNASCTRHLRDTRDRCLHISRRSLHQISQLINDDYDVWDFVG